MSQPDSDKPGGETPSENKGSGGPSLLYIMLGIIIVAIILFLVLRPRGATSGGSRSALALASQTTTLC